MAARIPPAGCHHSFHGPATPGIERGGVIMLEKRSFILTTIVVAIAFLAGAGNLYAQETKTFKVTAKRYEFIPGTIRVNQGDKVVLEVTAIDREHGFGLKAYGINRDLPKGKTVTIEFVADKKGEFTIKCTKFCGWGHFGMQGKLIVS
jgi:cytochrome c oxidase subunit II